MNGLALFAGYGGLEIGIDAAFGAVRTVGYVERESYAAATLVARMAEQTLDQAPIWDDVTTFDGRPWRGVVDIISAGFPCQPFSMAGARRGKTDERWLWDDIERIICEVRPRWVVGENVSGFVSLGLDAVLRSFASLGYDVSWGAFRAEQVGAAHRRERIFILAHLAQDSGCVGWRGGDLQDRRERQRQTETSGLRGSVAELADAQSSNSGKSDAGHGRQGFERRGQELADSNGERCKRKCIRIQRGGQDEEGAEATGRGAELAHTDGSRRWAQGDGELESSGIDRSHTQLGDGKRKQWQSRGEIDAGQNADEGSRDLFAPGPADLNLWARLLAESPEVEPSFCRMADGAAERLDHTKDRLRACGNGVVPLQAAVAIRVLAARAGWSLI